MVPKFFLPLSRQFQQSKHFNLYASGSENSVFNCPANSCNPNISTYPLQGPKTFPSIILLIPGIQTSRKGGTPRASENIDVGGVWGSIRRISRDRRSTFDLVRSITTDQPPLLSSSSSSPSSSSLQVSPIHSQLPPPPYFPPRSARYRQVGAGGRAARNGAAAQPLPPRDPFGHPVEAHPVLHLPRLRWRRLLPAEDQHLRPEIPFRHERTLLHYFFYSSVPLYLAQDGCVPIAVAAAAAEKKEAFNSPADAKSFDFEDEERIYKW